MLNKAVLHLLSAAHLEHFKKINLRYCELSLARFLEEYCLSVNAGRQFGHSSFLVEAFEKDPYSFIVTNKSSQLSHHLNMSKNQIYLNPRIIKTNSNNMGKYIDLEDDVIYTLLIDRGSYWKSNRNICEDIALELTQRARPYENIKNIRLIIVG